MHTILNPVGNMNLLSPIEVEELQHSAASELYLLYRNCSLAVLNAGSHTDDAEVIYQQYYSLNNKWHKIVINHTKTNKNMNPHYDLLQ